MVLKIGLTGGIGSGKSTVAKIFETIGIPVFYADEAARNAVNENELLKQKIKEIFGEASYTNGILNRKYIADIVFKDAFQLEKLNALIHPVTIAMAEEWMQQQATPYVIKEAAILFESGAAAGLDYIIGVFAPKHLRLQRVMHRDHVNRDAVLERMNRQIDEDMKMKLCDFVLTNDEQQLLIPQVVALHEKLLTLSKERPA